MLYQKGYRDTHESLFPAGNKSESVFKQMCTRRNAEPLIDAAPRFALAVATKTLTSSFFQRPGFARVRVKSQELLDKAEDMKGTCNIAAGRVATETVVATQIKYIISGLWHPADYLSKIKVSQTLHVYGVMLSPFRPLKVTEVGFIPP